MLRPLSINHYLNVMLSLGYGRDDLIAATAIDPAALSDPNYLVSSEDHQRFMHNMIALQGDKGLGLDLGLTNEATHFGILAYAGLSCRTIRQGMQDVWSRYGGAFGVATRLSIIAEDQDTAVVEIFAPHLDEPIYRFSIEEALCVLLKMGGGAVSGAEAPFLSITVSYPPPTYAARYHNLFSCPVSFRSHLTCVTLRRNWLDSPLKTTDPELNRACLDHLDRVLRQTEAASPVTLRLRHLLLSRVAAMPSLDEAAQSFGLSSRTLARQLQQDGYTYRRLAEEIRMELAKRWLASGVTTKEVSYRLGFSDAAAFRRAFKAWSGQTVGDYLEQPAKR